MHKPTKTYLKILCCLIALLALFPDQAHAYIDLGTGSYIIQLIIGAFLGGALAIKMYWRNLINFFKKKSPKDPKN